ncbi:hypothetical protein lerEdw1_014429 [Lerista edwardsae]|nr:hypothetical protein lerEdw1_014429 [Lerista edwardsae]
MILWLFVVAFILLLLIWNLDSWFLIKEGIPYLYFYWWKEASKDIFKTFVFRSIVLPADLDFLGHMNNARFLRDADIALSHLYAAFKLPWVLDSLGARWMICTSSIRHCRALGLFQRFNIHTRIIGWDNQAVYMEQLFVHPSNDFIFAVLHGRCRVTGMPAPALMDHLAGKKVESPKLPEEILHWVKYNECSSQRLRAEGNFQEKSKVH